MTSRYHSGLSVYSWFQKTSNQNQKKQTAAAHLSKAVAFLEFCRTDAFLIKSNHIFPITASLRNDTSHPMVGMASLWPPGRTCGTKDLNDTSILVYRLYVPKSCLMCIRKKYQYVLFTIWIWTWTIHSYHVHSHAWDLYMHTRHKYIIEYIAMLLHVYSSHTTGGWIPSPKVDTRPTRTPSSERCWSLLALERRGAAFPAFFSRD